MHFLKEIDGSEFMVLGVYSHFPANGIWRAGCMHSLKEIDVLCCVVLWCVVLCCVVLCCVVLGIVLC